MANNFPKNIEIHQSNGNVITELFSQTFQDSLLDASIFSDLIKELRFKNRYILSDEHAKFLDNYIKYAKLVKSHKFNESEKFYRARINEYEMGDKCFSLGDMGAPLSHQTSQSRVNPIGIPYLYLASNIDTAVSEVRPWKNCIITVAEFALEKDIYVINFSNKVPVNVNNNEQHKIVEQYENMENTWRELITYLFSMPFDPRDDIAYIPTQYISEKFKKEGFDGIIYDSALNEAGYNLCLFDVGMAKANKGSKVTVNSMDIKMSVEVI